MNDKMTSRALAAGAFAYIGSTAMRAHSAATMEPTPVESNFRFPHKGPTEFELRGENSTFGQYSSFGEILDLKTGDALGVLTDQDGDQIVGAVKLDPEAVETTPFHFSWRPSVQLNNGRRYVNTGKFA